MKRLHPLGIDPVDNAGDLVADGTYVLEVVDGRVVGFAAATGGSGVVETIVEGDHITVDATDPANPVVSAEPGLPNAGATGETLAKLSGTDADADWIPDSKPTVVLPAGSVYASVDAGVPDGALIIVKAP